ncbi:gamma interferon inducible lysosomal thiol reductase [Oesophagostomum dentatum]|uniref:Gamma interferon inducible lysosomal thiol reductase n=1 Tax=Oesophagostomum dentatum TaxID=61180 RepID=A0A0B1SXT7_OESDE|nr:gamma interferon inducible lysosomal thiol reductase [Oesophagostomum dentatum]
MKPCRRTCYVAKSLPKLKHKFLQDGSFSCNHGKKECDANRLQSCVIDIFKASGALPFIVCFERVIHHNTVEQAMHACSAFIRSQYRQIRLCYDGERGIQLQRIAAHKTMSTKPHPILEVRFLSGRELVPRDRYQAQWYCEVFSYASLCRPYAGGPDS